MAFEEDERRIDTAAAEYWIHTYRTQTVQWVREENVTWKAALDATASLSLPSPSCPREV